LAPLHSPPTPPRSPQKSATKTLIAKRYDDVKLASRHSPKSITIALSLRRSPRKVVPPNNAGLDDGLDDGLDYGLDDDATHNNDHDDATRNNEMEFVAEDASKASSTISKMAAMLASVAYVLNPTVDDDDIVSENDNKRDSRVPSVIEGEIKQTAIKGVERYTKGETKPSAIAEDDDTEITTDGNQGTLNENEENGVPSVTIGETNQHEIEGRVHGVVGVVSDHFLWQNLARPSKEAKPMDIHCSLCLAYGLKKKTIYSCVKCRKGFHVVCFSAFHFPQFVEGEFKPSFDNLIAASSLSNSEGSSKQSKYIPETFSFIPPV
jgi:hypothetical protein